MPASDDRTRGLGGPVRVELPSRLELLTVVNAVAEEVCESLELDEETRDSIATSVIEAATNAMEHGNRLDAAKTVVVVFESTEDRLRVRIRDQGAGFDLDAVANPLTPDNLMRERGRGIFLLRHFMDEVNFAQDPGKGMVVELVKTIPRSDPARSVAER